MKKIIFSTVCGVLLSAGSVMAAGVPSGGHDMDDLTVAGNGYGHAGGMQALTDGISLEEDALAAMFNGPTTDKGRGAWADGVFLPPGYLNNGKDLAQWMEQHAQHQGEGSPVPLPGTLLLLGSGIAGMFFIRRSSMHTS
ncbi:MAG: PEP-CTERM sorting domain-containing protein [Thermodesulfobacteriota bacterium]